jgi:hypothetical protein
LEGQTNVGNVQSPAFASFARIRHYGRISRTIHDRIRDVKSAASSGDHFPEKNPRTRQEARMPRYWVISPYEYDRKHPEIWEKVWRDDLANGIISIGFTKLGDVSALNEEQLRKMVDRTYNDKPTASRAIRYRMMRDLYHSVNLQLQRQRGQCLRF